MLSMFNKYPVKRLWAILLTMIVFSSNMPTASAQDQEARQARQLFLPLIVSSKSQQTTTSAEASGINIHATNQSAEILESDLVKVFNVQKLEDGLGISLRWQEESKPLPEMAVLALLNQSNQELASVEVQPKGDGQIVTEMLPDISTFIEQSGLQYWVALKDLSGQLLAQQPFRLTFSCASTAECTVEILDNIYTEALLMSPELDQAFDEVEARNPNTTDILQEMLTYHPELSGEIYGLSLQMSFIDSRQQASAHYKISGKAKMLAQSGPCACWHVAVVNRTPPQSRMFVSGVSPAESAGFDGAGANHYFGARSRMGQINHGFLGQVELTMKMRCWGITGWTWKNINIINKRWLKITISIKVPQFGWCSQQCQGTVTHELVDYHAHVRAEVRSISPFAYALATETVQYSVNGSRLIIPKSAAAALAFSGNPLQFDTIPTTSLGQTAPLPSSSHLIANGVVDVSAWENDYAYADVVNDYTMKAVANAPCALPRTLSSTVSLLISGTMPPTTAGIYDFLFHQDFLRKTMLP